MEEKINPWKLNLTNGLILGLVGVVYSLLMYFLDLFLNKTQGWAFLIIMIFLLFYLLKSYRDNYRHGMITYGQSVGAGVIIVFYYAIIMAVFTYIMYAVIDPGLVAKQLAATEEQMVSRGTPQAAIDAGMSFTEKLMNPAVMAITAIFVTMFFGTIISLIVSIFVKKEGNPLIDTPAN